MQEHGTLINAAQAAAVLLCEISQPGSISMAYSIALLSSDAALNGNAARRIAAEPELERAFFILHSASC
jgi:hypothetical protein